MGSPLAWDSGSAFLPSDPKRLLQTQSSFHLILGLLGQGDVLFKFLVCWKCIGSKGTMVSLKSEGREKARHL